MLMIDARSYYMRLCLHDFRDEDCVKILTRIREAMKPGYSRLIIHESVIPDRGPHPWAAAADINKMGATASFERTREQWAALLRRAGLEEPTLFYPKDPSCHVAIESGLKA